MDLRTLRKSLSLLLSITILFTNTLYPTVVFAQGETITTGQASIVVDDPEKSEELTRDELLSSPVLGGESQESTSSAETGEGTNPGPTQIPEITPPPTETPEPILDFDESPDSTATSTATPESSPFLDKETTKRNKDVGLLQKRQSISLDKTKTEGNSLKEKKSQDKGYVEGEVIVKFKREKLDVKRTLGKVQAYVFEKRHGLDKKDEIKNLNIQVFKSKKSTEELVEELKSDPKVEYAQPNYIYKPATINTNDTYKDLLWGLDDTNDNDIDAPEAWEISEGSGTIVAVIDSGVAYNHPDLINNMWDGSSCKDENGDPLGGCNSGYDYEDDDKDPAPSTSSHGTHIAGTIAAVKNNGKGIIGVAPDTRIMAIKTMLSTTEIVKGINFSEYNGARIINASWGGSNNDIILESAISGFDGLFIAAAGNGTNNDGVGKDNDTSHFYPCDFDSANIVCVAATDQDDGLASLSNYSVVSVDVGAPGVDIYSTVADITQTTVLNETFEGVPDFDIPSEWTRGGTNNNWGTYDLGGAWGKVLYGDMRNIPYTQTSNTTITSSSYSLGGSTKGEMNFWVRCDTEYKIGDFCDYMQLEYSSNGTDFSPASDSHLGEGSKWDEPYLDWLDGDSDPSGMAVYFFDGLSIPKSYLTDNFKFRLRWIANGNSDTGGGDGCLIDDIQITKYALGGAEEYGYMSGTSMATPHVAGLAGLIWSYQPELTYSQVKDVILETGDSLSSLAERTVAGKRINAFKALNEVTNNAPVAENDTASVDEDETLTVAQSDLLANDGDIDEDELFFDGVSNPVNGSVSVSGSDILFTPGPDFNGEASFDYTISDGSLTDTATVVVTVNPVNDAPVANDGSASTEEDASVDVTLSGSDVDGDSLTYAIVDGPSHGALGEVEVDQVTYTPSSDYAGSDSFTFKANDGTADSNTATVTVTVNEVDDPPVLDPIGDKTVDELALLTFTATATDPDDPLTYSLVGAPTGAAIDSDTGVFTFTPTEAQGPNDYTLTVNVTDGNSTDSEEITVTVNEVNLAPVASDDSFSTDEDTAEAITLVATDSDLPAQTLTYSIVDDPAHGAVSLSGDEATYTPGNNYAGSDSFTFKANDGTADSNLATVSITVDPINDSPTALGDTASVDEDETLTVAQSDLLANDGDIDEDDLTFDSVGNPVNGSVSVSGPDVVFTPDSDFNGEASFDYTISDGSLTDTATVVVTVNPVNDPPVITLTSPNGGQFFAGGSQQGITWTASDIDAGDVLTVDLEYVVGANDPVLISSSLTNSGSYSWSVPEIDSSSVKIKATVSDGAISDFDLSDADFVVDSTAPSGLTSSSSSHTTSTWSNDNTVEVNWSGASDVSSGINGYYTEWNNSDSELTGILTKEYETSVASETSQVLADGTSHYFHVAVVDKAGNWSTAVHLGPFWIDVTPPSALSASPASGVYDVAQNVTLSSSGSDSIRYSTSEIIDSCDGGTVYSDPITISISSTVFAIACDVAGNKRTGSFNFIISSTDLTPPSGNQGQVSLGSSLTLTNDTVLDLVNGVDVALGGNIMIGGVSQSLDDFTSGDLSGKDLSTTQNVGGQAVLVEKAVKLESTGDILFTNNDLSGVSISIPNNTTVLASSGWNGQIFPPKEGSGGGSAPSGFSIGGTVIEVGAPGMVLLFDKPVTILLTGVTGSVGYKAGGSDDWVEISNQCGGSYDAPLSPTFPGECYISNGEDTKILTYHFTSFADLDSVLPATSSTSISTPTSTSDSASQPASAPVCTDSKPASVPVLLSVVAVGPNEVTLTWSKTLGPVTYYLIAFGLSSGNMVFGNPNVGGSNVTSYTVKGLSSGTKYYFKVRAGNNCMPGDFSNELFVIPYGEVISGIPEGFSENVLGVKTTDETAQNLEENQESRREKIDREPEPEVLGVKKPMDFPVYLIGLILSLGMIGLIIIRRQKERFKRPY